MSAIRDDLTSEQPEGVRHLGMTYVQQLCIAHNQFHTAYPYRTAPPERYTGSGKRTNQPYDMMQSPFLMAGLFLYQISAS